MVDRWPPTSTRVPLTQGRTPQKATVGEPLLRVIHLTKIDSSKVLVINFAKIDSREMLVIHLTKIDSCEVLVGNALVSTVGVIGLGELSFEYNGFGLGRSGFVWRFASDVVIKF